MLALVDYWNKIAGKRRSVAEEEETDFGCESKNNFKTQGKKGRKYIIKVKMSYFTDYKRQMMGHSRYFDATPHDYPVDFRRNNFEGAFHHQHHTSNTPYNELPARFSNNYGHGPAVGSHMPGSYDNLMFHQQQHHIAAAAAARRSRETYQNHETTPAAAPYYYHNNSSSSANSPMMNQYYHANESYRKDSASPYHHHHWMTNGAAGATGGYNNSQYYPPSVNYGSSSPYYPTPPPSASPAGTFYPKQQQGDHHRVPSSYEYDYYNKEKSAEASSNDHNNHGYFNSESSPASRPMFSPKMDYQVGHLTPTDVETSNRKHYESQRTTATEQMASPALSEPDNNFSNSKDATTTRSDESGETSENSSIRQMEKIDSTFFKKSEATGEIWVKFICEL